MGFSGGIRSRSKGSRKGYRSSHGPILNLDFADGNGTLHTDITFTRASAATFFDKDGVLQTAASDAARVDAHTYDGTNWLNRGFLIEEARTNLMLHNEDADNAVHTQIRVTISQDTAVAPDGNTTMDSVLETAVTNTFHQNYDTMAVDGDTAYTWSLFVKKLKTRQYVEMQVLANGTGTEQHQAVFDLDAGAFTASLQDDSGTQALFVEDVGGGIYRIGESWTTVADDTTIIPQIWIADADEGDSNHVGDITEGVYAWGAQFEAGAYPTSYMGETEGATITRAADVATYSGINFGTDVGTLFGEGTLEFPTDENRIMVQLSTSSSAQSIDLRLSTAGGGRPKGQMTGETPAFAISTGADWADGETIMMALAYQVGLSEFASDGSLTGAPVTITDLPTQPDRITIGAATGGANAFNGFISRVTVWSQRLSDGRIASLTA